MILAVFNPKGGVGKTTTAVNLAASFAEAGRSVVLVDLEADMNASISLGVGATSRGPSIVDSLLRRRQAEAPVRAIAAVPGLHLVPGSPELAELDTLLRHVRQPERRLADALRPLVPAFEVIVLDAPSGYSVLNLSVPTVAQHLLVPVRAEYLCLESLAHFLRWYRNRRRVRKDLATITGILLTRTDYRQQATREIVDIIRLHNRRGVFRTEIPEDPRASEAPSHGLPLMAYAPSSRSARAYAQLAGEVRQRIDRRSR
jgi:chromosome partitioning protein